MKEMTLKDVHAVLLEIAKVFHRICVEHNIPYYMLGGTMLGAVRHKGFIPWDDDMDIAMPRKDYEKALEILPEELSKYGITAKESEGYPMHRMGVGYMHTKTGVWVDIFPVDEYVTNEPMEQCEEELKARIVKFRDYYQKNHTKSVDVLNEMKKNVMGGGILDGTTKLLYHGPEFRHSKLTVFEKARVYPLQKVSFEGYMLKAPAKLDEYLTMQYGVNYMQFPKGGTEHHDLGRGPLKTWAKRNGVDMNEVRKHLQSIEI